MPPAGAADVFVNIGDMLARRTNDELCSTWHRVVAPADAADMWGAQVRLPCDMGDDVLRDAIESVREELNNLEATQGDWEGPAGSEIVERIKRKFDSKWSPSWHVVIGRSYGSFVTHETRQFVSFKINDKAVMLYKV